MEISYGRAKNEKNVRERGLDFRRASEFEFGTADIRQVWRHGELRMLATGLLVGRVHVLASRKMTMGEFGLSASERRISGSGIMKRADAIWNKGPKLIDDDAEVRELTKEDFDQMVPYSQLPADLQHTLMEIPRGNVTFVPDEEKVFGAGFAVSGGAISSKWKRVGRAGG